MDHPPELPGAPPETQADVAVRALNFQLFCLVYLQKFAVGPGSFQLSVTMLVMLAGLVWLVGSGRVGISARRLVLYLTFVGSCFLSQIIADGSPSMSSLIYLTVLYSFMTVVAELPADRYAGVLDRFVKLMILPACVIIFQYAFQTATGSGNPISMNRMLPGSILLHGYIYEAPYHWGFAFTRPNGFFFLETSYASAFAASAAIIEATYFRRPLLLGLMTAATFLSLGGTGVTMLIVAAPFLVARLSARAAGLVVAAVMAALLAAYLLNVPLPLLSRMNELHTESSSGADRLLVPASHLANMLMDPSFLFRGTGAGSATAEEGSLWPLAKLLQEYGLVAMMSFIAFYVIGIIGNFNVPLKIALTITYNFTGGYLLTPVMVELLVLLCFIAAPAQPAPARQASPMRGWLQRRSPATR
jgi:hypothetical protein